MSIVSSLTARGSHSRSLRLSRKASVAGATLAVLASYAVVGPVTTAQAASLSGSTFEIDTDANLTPETADDWLVGGVLRGAVRNDTPSGSSDNSFKSTHEDSAVPEVEFGSIPNNKADLKSFGVYVERTATKVFLNVFWTRVQDPSGSTDVDFEFNQSAVTDNDPQDQPQIIPVRTVGDLLMTYSLSNGGSVATIEKRFWGGSSWGAASTLSASDAIGSINATPIAAADSGGLGAFTARTFAEASVDLAALLPVDQGCKTYGSAYLKSRSSPSFSSEMKDFIAPEGVTISNCGVIKIHKSDANGPLAGAGFTLYNDVAPLGGSIGVGDTAVVPAATCTTDGNGDCTIPNVKKGTYLLHESTVPAGHDAVADQAVSITAGDQVVSLDLVDPIQTGTITVTKDAQPNDAKDFTFTLDSTSFSLDDDSDGTLPSTRSFTVPVGSHTVTETNIPSGWTLSNLSCTKSGGQSAITINGAVAAITLAKDETVACTYVDAFTPLSPNLTTTAASAGAGGWNDSAGLTGDGVHPITGTVDFYACAPTATATACAAGTKVGTTQTVTGSGSAFLASTSTPWQPSAAGWTCFRAVFTSTSGFYSNDSHTNATTECFLKQAQDLSVSKTAHAAYGRLYSWTVDKQVDAARVAIAAGDTAHSAYTVTVRNTHVDSAWTVSGTITVTNPNPVAFTGVAVTDAIDNGAGSCAVTGGASATVPANSTLDLAYVCTYSTQPAPTKGTNTATATWNGATYFTPNATASGTAAADFADVSPSVTDEQASVVDSVVGTLGTLDAREDPNPKVFTYTVDRSGVAGTCTTYDNTATVTANDSASTTSSSKSVVVCVGSDLTANLTGTATNDRDHGWTIGKNVDRSRAEVPQGSSASFTYTVDVAPVSTTDSNHALSGSVTVANPNDWEAISATVTVASDLGGGVSCTVTGGSSASVPASGNVSLPYSCTFTGLPAGSGHVTATITWNAATAHTPHGSATAATSVAFTVVHETHATVTVVDDKTDPAHPVTLGTREFAAGPTSYTYSLTLPGVVGACTPYTNVASLTQTSQTATKTVTVCVGADLTVTKTALATNHRTYLWSLAKNVDRTTASIAAGGTATFAYTVTATPSGTTDDGWSVTGQIVVSNPNSWEPITANITDVVDSGGGSSCLVTGATGLVVPASGSVTLPYTCSFTSKPANGTNTATATWSSESASTPHGTATGAAPVVFVPNSETNKTVTLVDDKTDPANPVTLGTATWGETPTVFTYSLTFPGVAGQCTTLTNTAAIAQTQQSAAKAVQVCVGQALTAVVTAVGSYDRDELWTISKSADRSTVTVDAGTAVPFTYTVTATPNGFSDSGFELAGTVTVTNPNAWESVTSDVAVATDLGGGAACVVTGGTGAAVIASGAVTLPFTCTFTSAPATTGTVTASATWDAALASTATGTASAAAPATLALDQLSHDVLTVVDDQTTAGAAIELGTVTWSEGPAAFTYTLSKTAEAGACSTYTNLATLVQTEQTATADVEVCGNEITGGGGGTTVGPPVTTGGGGGLAFTGDLTGVLGRWALGLLLGGAVLLLLGRRRTV